MSNTEGPQTPAGWFRDPGGTDQLRWWDGTRWTVHLTPVPPAAPPPVAQAPVVPQVLATPTFTPSSTFAQEPQPDPTQRPYVPFRNAWSNPNYVPGSGEFVRPLQWNTAGVWFLATSLLWAYSIFSTVFVGYGFAFGFSQLSTTVESGAHVLLEAELELAGALLVLLLLLVAASRDRARLQRYGYLQLTSTWWVLLVPPLVYLIIRTVRVRRESGHGAAPLVFFLVDCAVIGLLSVAAVVVVFAAVLAHPELGSNLSETANAKELAAEITTGMDKSGGSYSVVCAPFAEPTTSPTELTCTALDLTTRVTHTLQIEIDPATDGGQPTDKLLSVTPPINQ